MNIQKYIGNTFYILYNPKQKFQNMYKFASKMLIDRQTCRVLTFQNNWKTQKLRIHSINFKSNLHEKFSINSDKFEKVIKLLDTNLN